MRNRLVHGYYDVDLDLVWGTLTTDLPPLIHVLEQHLASERERARLSPSSGAPQRR
jgi:uncharacterized protein with HEPN domain